jgi:hypothetical protein
MDFVPFLEKEFCEIRAVLAGDAGYQGSLAPCLFYYGCHFVKI